MNMRFVVKTHLHLQRFEVWLAVMLPFFLIFESALANGTVYAGGTLDFHDPRSWIAFGRGLFFEILTYASAKLARLSFTKRHWLSGGITALVALWCIVVSAGNNLGWVISGGDFVGVFASMGHFMPAPLMLVYEAGLGLLLPLSVGALALVDIAHLVHEAIDNATMENRALEVEEADMHRTEYLKSQRKQQKKISERYDRVAEVRTDAFARRVEAGDMTFGASAREDKAKASARVALGSSSPRAAIGGPQMPQAGPMPFTVNGQAAPQAGFPPIPGGPTPMKMPAGAPNQQPQPSFLRSIFK